ncbi:MAG: tyrosine--tRNA ligase [Candidatus Moranbacteria bacterium RIFOXYA12_FULL_35_19]|nr:MAG: tyrosine--tRNA ligase [Candidatus Moranbacteria bacterium RIFOXYB12_FULL_35_8]OGI32071.1 MAG: tyrosine--tRNA ligase [Candidatus Moranbacteria bacterium RIFOXYC12_FULL_36_13]OGI35357.1 MAG: tyrosine--tRNA ligase [Candidatus Moranbacteria bacterium RIFOXYA12_FULL_35_19]
MAKIITDEKLIDELLERSVEEVLPSKGGLKKLLMSGKKIRIYIGTDPTGTSLHLGHATNYIILEKFRKLGHEVIFLIGDFTARIGDPTDKISVRKQLTRSDVKKNIKTWLKQVKPVISFNDKENPVKIMFNHDWLSKLTFEDVIKLASNFTVQQMLERDMFEKRMKEEKPIYLHEFFYPLMQGYDSVVMDVDIEMCGNDQKFNALIGRTLLRKLKDKEKFVFITTLLENPVTKEKMMSKSLGTGVFLDENDIDMFGRIMAQPDENIPQLFTDCTYISLDKIKKIKKDLENSKINPRDAKIELAYEITKIYHGEKKANEAKEYFEKVISRKETPEEVKEEKIDEGERLIDFIVKIKLAQSNADAKRKIEQGGVSLDGEIIKDIQTKISKAMDGKILKVGKREFRKIVVE